MMSQSSQSDFNKNEARFYSRQIAIPQLGNEGQLRLKNSKIAVIGAGGLGAPVLHYLAAAGMGTIGIFDNDRVEESNLHRQVLFTVSDIGKLKAEIAADRLSRLNPHIQIIPYQTRITSDNATKLLANYDLVIDGSDNFLTRYIVNDACLILDIPLVYGSIYRFEGQVTVFNYVDEDGFRGPELYDLFPELPEPGFIPDCKTAGVLGALPGVIGSIQATEAIKIVARIGNVLSGKLLVMDLLNMDTHLIAFSESDPDKTINPSVVQDRLRKYGRKKDMIRQITVQELSKLKNRSEEVNLIDVRSAEEHARFNVGGQLIPLDKIDEYTGEISAEKKTVVYCQSGQRSAEAIRRLKKKAGGDQLYNLTGGVQAWMEFVEKSEK